MKRTLVTAVLAGLVAARLGAGGVSIKGAYVEARTAGLQTRARPHLPSPLPLTHL